MADETPETPETAESASADSVGSSASAERSAAETAESASADSAVPQTPKERKVAARNRRGKRRGATPEERAAERAEKAVARRRRREQEREKAKAARAAAGPVENVPPRAEHGPGRPKVRLGIVSSDKGDKTITVVVDEARKHRKYQKIVRSTQKLHAHDERNDAGTGDRVRIVECRPMSASKRWRLDEVLERAR